MKLSTKLKHTYHDKTHSNNQRLAMNTAASTSPILQPEYAYNDRYINRELSILNFHLRVFEQAVDPVHIRC